MFYFSFNFNMNLFNWWGVGFELVLFFLRNDTQLSLILEKENEPLKAFDTDVLPINRFLGTTWVPLIFYTLP